ncbi:hypothetical protein PP301_gp020 [Gordonia phage GMA2]|uniref:Uncharacterized protein n=1 Tax=Gordonia phage GMA2 TaxID=1647283 RepID=A0A0K0N729_9CAUD|nr:hypothetical protein PP301_gp020 [Gordonia phage GMA2]AKJ72558.1 hypothetical protein GMA2_20 [Gordonia phage GMA2]
MSTIDDLGVDAETPTAAQLPGAPFPEDGPIPTANVELEAPKGDPDAFGSSDTAAPDGVEDAEIEPSDYSDEIPVTYAEAAKALGSNDAGNEFDNLSVAPGVEFANKTSAEELSTKSEDKKPEPKKAARPPRRVAKGDDDLDD